MAGTPRLRKTDADREVHALPRLPLKPGWMHKDTVTSAVTNRIRPVLGRAAQVAGRAVPGAGLARPGASRRTARTCGAPGPAGRAMTGSCAPSQDLRCARGGRYATPNGAAGFDG